MPKQTASSDPKPFIITHTSSVLVLISLVLLIVFGSLWWTKVYNSPRRVFEEMLKNNLSTASVTRTSSSVGQQDFERIEQLSFVEPVAARTYIRLVEQSADGQASVETETIGTQRSDYSQYLNINIGGQAAATSAYKAVEGIWGQSSIVDDGEPQYLVQALQGLVPFANLGPADRTKILDIIKTKEVYKVNYASTKPKKINGKSAIDFSVTVSPAQYVAMIQELAKVSGIEGLASLDASQYQDQPDVNINIVVDKLSRQIIEVNYGQQKEVYSAYGLNRAVTLPEKTIPFRDLQQKIQAIQ